MAEKKLVPTPEEQQLKAQLKEKSPATAYVLYGEEDYLRRYYLAQIKKLLLDPLTESFNFHHLTVESFSLQALSDALNALPMMAERSVVLVEDVPLFTLKEDEREMLCALLSDLPPHCCLVFTYEDFKPDKRMKKLWDALSKNTLPVELCYRSETDLRPWVARHFRAEQKQISTELCSYLVQTCGASMTVLDREIAKICAYSGAETIVRADIDAVATPTLDAVVYQLTDAVALRKFDRALERLNILRRMKTEPIMLLAAIGRQFRSLYAVKQLQAQGKGVKELMQLYGLRDYSAQKTITQARQMSETFCRKAVVLCAQTDYRLKTSADDGDRLIELLLLQLAQEAQRD